MEAAGGCQRGRASCLREGCPGSGTLPPGSAHPWGVLLGPATHWLSLQCAGLGACTLHCARDLARTTLCGGISVPWHLLRLRGAPGGRPRTGVMVPAAGACRSRGTGLTPHRTRQGPREGFVPGGSLRRWSPAACAAVVWRVSTRSLTRLVSRAIGPWTHQGLGQCTRAVLCGRRHLCFWVGGRHARVPCVCPCACFCWLGRGGRPLGCVVRRLTFSCGRFRWAHCLLGPLRARVALFVFVSFLSFAYFFSPFSPSPVSPACFAFRPWVLWALVSCCFPHPAWPPPLVFSLFPPCALVVSCFVLSRPRMPWAMAPLVYPPSPFVSCCVFRRACSTCCPVWWWCARSGPSNSCVPPPLPLSCCWLSSCVVAGGTVRIAPLPCLGPRAGAASGAVAVSFVLLSCCAVPVVCFFAPGCCSCFVLGAALLRLVCVLCCPALPWCELYPFPRCGALPRCGPLCCGALCPSPPTLGVVRCSFVLLRCSLCRLGLWCSVCVAVGESTTATGKPIGAPRGTGLDEAKGTTQGHGARGRGTLPVITKAQRKGPSNDGHRVPQTREARTTTRHGRRCQAKPNQHTTNPNPERQGTGRAGTQTHTPQHRSQEGWGAAETRTHADTPTPHTPERTGGVQAERAQKHTPPDTPARNVGRQRKPERKHTPPHRTPQPGQAGCRRSAHTNTHAPTPQPGLAR